LPSAVVATSAESALEWLEIRPFRDEWPDATLMRRRITEKSCTIHGSRVGILPSAVVATSAESALEWLEIRPFRDEWPDATLMRRRITAKSCISPGFGAGLPAGTVATSAEKAVECLGIQPFRDELARCEADATSHHREILHFPRVSGRNLVLSRCRNCT